MIDITQEDLKAGEEEVTGTDSALDRVEVPKGLSARQIQLAKHNTIEKMKQGYTVSNFCKDFSVSTKSWCEWINVPEFNSYLTALSNAVYPDDEMLSYQMMKKHVSKLAHKQNPTPKEVELFMNVFGYLVEADKRNQMEKLGLNKPQTGNSDARTVEEKRNALLSRLKGNSN